MRLRAMATTNDTALRSDRPSQMAGASSGAATQYRAIKNTDATTTNTGCAKKNSTGPRNGILQIK